MLSRILCLSSSMKWGLGLPQEGGFTHFAFGFQLATIVGFAMYLDALVLTPDGGDVNGRPSLRCLDGQIGTMPEQPVKTLSKETWHKP